MEFVHTMSRHFHLATVSQCAGLTLKSKMFGVYPVVFCGEDGLDEELVDRSWLDFTNCFVVDEFDPELEDDVSIPHDMLPRRVTVSMYDKVNCRDRDLDPKNELTCFLLSLSDKSNVGIHIDRHNMSVLDVASTYSILT